MKKTILVILGIFIIILLFAVGLLYNYNIGIQKAKYFNEQYSKYYQKTISGTDLATLLNKTMDYNNKNNIEKDDKDIYFIENDKSILIQVKFLEKDEPVKMEDILKQNMENFIKYYGAMSFTCTGIKYHEETNQVKSLYFEQTNLN